METESTQVLYSSSKKMLDEISFIRPILLVLLVVYHAFAPWCSNWEMPLECHPSSVNSLIGSLAYVFMLETYVFVSGYVWAFQRNRKGEETFWILIKKKFQRLLVPCWLFGIFYAIIFANGGGII